MKIQMKFKNILLYFFCITIFIFVKHINAAYQFQSDTYIIDWGTFNITSGTKASTNFKLSDTVGQNAPGEYTNSPYILQSGFQYIYNTLNKFSFIIEDDDLEVDLGTLTAGVGKTSSHYIAISSPAGNGYQIMAHQVHPLQTQIGVSIPNTSCNVGSTCTISSSNTWTSSTSYGFGYNALGVDASNVVNNVGTSSYFTDANKYRPFANQSLNPPENNQIFMSQDHPVTNQRAQITYKVNISSIQASGKYETAIVFTAVPKY